MLQTIPDQGSERFHGFHNKTVRAALKNRPNKRGQTDFNMAHQGSHRQTRALWARPDRAPRTKVQTNIMFNSRLITDFWKMLFMLISEVAARIFQIRKNFRNN